jgi:hypothetical protein
MHRAEVGRGGSIAERPQQKPGEVLLNSKVLTLSWLVWKLAEQGGMLLTGIFTQVTPRQRLSVEEAQTAHSSKKPIGLGAGGAKVTWEPVPMMVLPPSYDQAIRSGMGPVTGESQAWKLPPGTGWNWTDIAQVPPPPPPLPPPFTTTESQ